MLRITVVAPVAAPYREPLFAALHQRDGLALQVIYADAAQPSWDVPEDFFATAHPYPATHLRSRQLPRPGRTPVMFPTGLARALAASQPDVVVASEYGPSAIRTRIWAAHHGVPHLLLTECTPEINALLPPLQLRWHHRFAHMVDGAIPVSSAARQRLLDFGVEDTRITVALQSADLAPIRAAMVAASPTTVATGTTSTVGTGTKSTAGTGAASIDGPLRVLSVGRLVPDKNVAVLARAVAQAAVDLAPLPIALDIVGDGFLRTRLAETAAELGIDATFHGHLDAPATAALYAQADVFALLSGYEPFGVVVREAAAAGLPIVASAQVGAVGDVAIDGANAIVVRPGDVSQAAVAITRILGDPALRARMASESRAIDAATAGREVDAFAAAVARAVPR